MPFYLRKRKKFGPMNINFSKSGLGISLGVKGARVALGPRGTQVNMGRRGIYYRKSLSSTRASGAGRARGAGVVDPAPQWAMNKQEHYPSEVDGVINSSSAEVLDQLNTNRGNWFFKLLGIRERTPLNFELDSAAEKTFRNVQAAIQTLATAQNIWLMERSGTVNQKYHGGANEVFKRRRISAGKHAPHFISTNVDVYGLNCGRQKLFFFPDRILVYSRLRYWAVEYRQLNVAVAAMDSRETGRIPPDGAVVGRTWKYVNLKGGPDGRFSHNPMLPIVRFGELRLSSSTNNLNLRLWVSNKGAADRCASLLNSAVSSFGSTP